MEPFDQYNDYHFQHDFYGGSFPQPPHPLPYPLPKIPKFQGLTGLGMRDVPFLPDVPNPGQGHADLYWQRLLDKLAQKRVPTPELPASCSWLQNTWPGRRSWEDENYDRPAPSPPLPPPQPQAPYTPRTDTLPPLATGPRSRMSDYTTASEYGNFYSRQDGGEGKNTYRVTSGAKLPPI